jgi:ABC-type amino acid transport substrate-binding protein
MTGRMVGTALLFLWLSGASGGAEPVRIAHYQLLPPFAEVQDGKSVGLAIDILRAVAARTGIDLVFVPMTIEEQMPSLTDGRADALYTAITPERRQSLDFSAPVLMTGGPCTCALRMPRPRASQHYPERSSSPRGQGHSPFSSKKLLQM